MYPKTEVFGKDALGGYKQSLCIERDKWGGIWVGTPEMVHHFNGEDWETVKLTEGFQMYALHVDEEERVWVGGQGDFGYLTIDDEQGVKKSAKKGGRAETGLRYVSLAKELPDSLKDFNSVWEIEKWGDRVLFNARDRIMIMEDEEIRTIEPKGESFFRVFRYEEELWVQDLKEGLYRLPQDTELRNDKGRLRDSLRVPNSSVTGGAYLTALIPPPNGITRPEELLFVSFKSGLYRLPIPSAEKKDSGMSRIPCDLEEVFAKAGCYHAIGPPSSFDGQEDRLQYPLSIGTSHKGLFLMDEKLRALQNLGRDRKAPSNDFWQLVRGSRGSGQIWAATEKGTVRILSEDPRSWGMEESKVHKVIEHRGRIWVATEHGVLLRRPGKSILSKGESGRWDTASSGSIKFFDLLSLQDKEKGSKGVIAAAGPSGAYVLKAGKKTDKEILALDAYQVSSLAPNVVAVGGREGIALLEKRERWELLLHVHDLPEEVRRMRVRPSKEEGIKELWCGFLNKGALQMRLPLNRLREELQDSSSFEWATIREEAPLGIEGAHYSKERLGKQVGVHPYQGDLILTSSKGLWRAKLQKKKEGDPSTQRYTFVPEDRFHKSLAAGREKGRGAFSFAEMKVGKDGTVWGFPFQGSYRFRPDGKGGYHLDSIPFKQLGVGNVNTVHSDTSGITWFGGKEGLVRYDPRIERSFNRAYPASIRKVRVELPEKDQKRKGKKDSLIAAGQYRVPAPEGSVLSWKRSIQQPEEQAPSLPYSLNGVFFDFSAYYFEGRDELRYSYKLEGYEKEWSPWQKATDKAYTNLWEGSYCFKVKARNLYGKKSKVASFRFRIQPPWYRTNGAYAGYGILAVILIWGVAKVAARRAELQRKRLERIVNERTREIQEKNQALTEEKARVEEAHKEITDSIDYAQKIQQALLQSEEYVSPHLPEHFILFKPQAKVSGDFYWAREQEGHLYVAAVDCTGHGVPGAFMSMLGISQLNEIMAAQELPAPGEILTELRERVVAELSSGDSEGGAKDGMDAALIRIPLSKNQNGNPNSQKVAFAGANNPLYVVKEGVASRIPEPSFYRQGRTIDPEEERIRTFRKSSDGFEVKGDKMAVGYEPDAAEAFTTIELDIPPDAMLYIFSDGYADQFGGSKGKKFRYGPFKELLARIHSMDPKEQKAELDRVFEEWKAEQEQVDDVCVVGIRVPDGKEA